MSERPKIATEGRYCVLGGEDVQCFAEVYAMDLIELHPLIESAKPERGDRITCCLNNIGMVDGFVIQLRQDGFVIQVVASPERRSRIEARLAWLRDAGERNDQRKAARIVPVHRLVRVQLEDDRVSEAVVADLSMTGAALLLNERPEVGALVTVGKRYATVVRHTPEGVGVAFRMPFGSLTFNERVIL